MHMMRLEVEMMIGSLCEEITARAENPMIAFL